METEPDKCAALDHNLRAFSYKALHDAVDLAQAILREAGVRAGDRVMVVAENSVAHMAMALACSRLDAWVVPVNARLTESELWHIRNHAQPRVCVFTTAASSAAFNHAKNWNANFLSVEGLDDLAVLGQLDAKPEPVFLSPNEQVAVLIYTTGTMGSPKGVMLTHANFFFTINAGIDVRNLTDTDYVYTAPPHTHIFALTVTLASLTAGAKVRFVPRFEPEQVFQAFIEGVSVFPAVPAMYNRLLVHAQQVGIEKPDAPALRYISAGGAPLDISWKQRVERFFDLPLQNGYGMTEAAPTLAMTRFDEHRQDTHLGAPPKGLEIRIAETPGFSGGEGEILCRGPNIMLGYYRNPEETAAALDAEGFLHTGDIGIIHEDGSLQLVGRVREVIIRSGFNVYPGEIEAVLNQHARVAQCAVVGRKVDSDEEVLAFIEVAGEEVFDLDEIKQHLRERLSAYKQPRHIVVVEKLPAAPTGKLLRSNIVDSFSEQLQALDATG
ncbi:MAG: AMP-binding protein [Pseudomonadota bacterium]